MNGPEIIPQEQIAALATLYDRFAHALDPYSAEADEAEHVFLGDVSNWYDSLGDGKPPLRDFTKAIILRCKRHLIATQKPPSV